MMLAIARAVDLLTTWLVSPDLQREMNPIVRWLGWKWTILLNGGLVLMASNCPPRLYACLIIMSFASAAWNVAIYVGDWTRKL